MLKIETHDNQQWIMLDKPEPFSVDTAFPVICRFRKDGLFALYAKKFAHVASNDYVANGMNEYGNLELKTLQSDTWHGSMFEVIGKPLIPHSAAWILWRAKMKNILIQIPALAFFLLVLNVMVTAVLYSDGLAPLKMMYVSVSLCFIQFLALVMWGEE
jgi:hypothetical protein